MGLFSGKPENKPSQPVATGRVERAPVATPQSANSSPAPTVIGKDAVIKGELESKYDMLIEGRVEGKIRGEQRVVIGESGNVKAQVHAQIVSVRGEVHGDCNASKKIEIMATGKVYGNIAAEAIVVAEGATFRGTSKMNKAAAPKPVEAKKTVPQTPSADRSTPAPRAN